MWSKILPWVKARPILAVAIAVLCLIALSSAAGGVRDWFQKRAEIQSLKKDIAAEKEKGEAEKAAWGKAMSAKENEYVRISRERDVLRKKIAGLQAAQAQPWQVPATDNELLTRFKAIGY
jgi:succinate dehydrogenase/fumarate reductase flavoprotein subunit